MENTTGVSDFGLFMIMFAVLLLLVGLIKVLSWLTLLQETYGSIPQAIGAGLRRYVLARPVLLSSSDSAPPNDAGMEPVYIPVSQTSMDDHTGTPAGSGMDLAAPDIDAPNSGMDGWELPRLSRHIDDGALLVLLAALRAPSGKHRFSANQIQTLIGGDRNTVLARVKELRAGAPPAIYPPRTPEQQQAREQLQLDQRT